MCLKIDSIYWELIIFYNFRTDATWKDGVNTYFKKLFKDYHYQGKVLYVMEDAKDLLENGLPQVVARAQG